MSFILYGIVEQMEIIYRENGLFVCIHFKHIRDEGVVSCGKMRMWASQSDVGERDAGTTTECLLCMGLRKGFEKQVIRAFRIISCLACWHPVLQKTVDSQVLPRFKKIVSS